MTEATRRWSWRSWLPDMSAAVSRFPLGVRGAIPPQTVLVDGLGTVRLEVAGNSLTASIESGPELRFDLTEAVNRLSGVVSTERRPLPIEAVNGALSGTVLIENLNGTYDGADLGLSLLRFWLVLKWEQ